MQQEYLMYMCKRVKTIGMYGISSTKYNSYGNYQYKQLDNILSCVYFGFKGK